MLYAVAMHGKTDQFFQGYIEANDPSDAQIAAIKFMEEQTPDIDPSEYNQTMAQKVYSITPFVSM